MVDLDKGDIAAAKAHLDAHLGQASMVVKSGGQTDAGQTRVHLYWRLSEVVSGANLARLCELRGILADKVGGDHAFTSAHQPIRIAGTIYGKSKVRRLVEIIDQADSVYSLSEIGRAVCAMPPLDGLPISRLRIDTGSKGPSAADLKLTKIRSDGRDEITRFAAVGKVIGHWLHVVRSGRITLDEAWGHVQEHNAACIDPPWELSRLRASFDAFLKRDIDSHGRMPNLDRLVASGDVDDEQSSQDAETSAASGVPGAVFLSEDC